MHLLLEPKLPLIIISLSNKTFLDSFPEDLNTECIYLLSFQPLDVSSSNTNNLFCPFPSQFGHNMRREAYAHRGMYGTIFSINQICKTVQSPAHLDEKSWSWRTGSPQWGRRSRWHQHRTRSGSFGKEWQRWSEAPLSLPPQQGLNTRPHHCCSPHLGKWEWVRERSRFFERLFCWLLSKSAALN